MKYILRFIIITGLLSSCGKSSIENKLPYMGRKNIVERKDAGKVYYDTIYHTIADFRFVNQDSIWITNETYKDKIYVADFFFTTCPTICPLMKKQMLRVYDKYKSNEKFAILSHTIDPNYDTVAILKSFAERLEVDTKVWNFVTGDQETIYDIGEMSYMVTAGEDENAEGGYIHSGAFLLIDMERHVRGVYDGTNTESVDVLMNDIEILLKEYEEVPNK